MNQQKNELKRNKKELVSLAKKKAECYSCGKKGYQENYIEERLDEEHSIYFCSECCREVTSEETILNEKIY